MYGLDVYLCGTRQFSISRYFQTFDSAGVEERGQERKTETEVNSGVHQIIKNLIAHW